MQQTGTGHMINLRRAQTVNPVIGQLCGKKSSPSLMTTQPQLVEFACGTAWSVQLSFQCVQPAWTHDTHQQWLIVHVVFTEMWTPSRRINLNEFSVHVADCSSEWAVTYSV